MAEQMGLGSFYTATINGNYTNANPLELAKEIIGAIPKDSCSFDVLHTYNGRRHAFGYIYNGGLYGFITIEQYSGFRVSYYINNGVYNHLTN